MKMQLRFLSQVVTRCCLPVVALTALAGAAFAQVSVYLPASDPNITYLGRVRVRQGGDTPFGKEGAGIQWPGSGFKTWIYGTSKVSLLLSTEGQQYINDGVYAPIKFKAIVDGNETIFSQPDPNQLYGSWYWNYDITGLDPYQVHTIELRRLVDPQRFATLHGITLEGPNGSSPQAYNASSSLSDKRIEFYGDSITAGGSAQPNVSSPDINSDGDYTNNIDYSYATLTANNFGADARYIAQGGAGLVRGYSNVQLENFWNLVDFDGQLHSDAYAAAFQNFSSWQPRIVVLAIGNNSYFQGVFGTEWSDAYRNFVSGLHSAYPDADIICMNTTMTNTMGDPYWEGAVNPLLNDPSFGGKVHFLKFDYQGHAGHPRPAEHQAMANALTQEIRNITGW